MARRMGRSLLSELPFERQTTPLMGIYSQTNFLNANSSCEENTQLNCCSNMNPWSGENEDIQLE